MSSISIGVSSAIGHIPLHRGEVFPVIQILVVCESLTNDRPVLTGFFLVGIYNLLSEV